MIFALSKYKILLILIENMWRHTLTSPPKLHPGLLPLPQRAWRDLWTIPNVSNVLWATVVTLIVRNPDRAEEKKKYKEKAVALNF